jgi:hypothetical protein
MPATAPQTAIAVVGIDIGKNSFHIIGLDNRGAIVLRQKWSRSQIEARFANMPPCLVGVEACVGAHHLSRRLKALGHDARLMPAKYVRPYSKGQKNDFRDAEAIAEAVQRPTMKFVATKTAEQLDLQALHRVRERLVSQRTGDREVAFTYCHPRRSERTKHSARITSLSLGWSLTKTATMLRIKPSQSPGGISAPACITWWNCLSASASGMRPQSAPRQRDYLVVLSLQQHVGPLCAVTATLLDYLRRPRGQWLEQMTLLATNG